MAPKRKRKPAAKSTKEVHGGSSSTPKDQVILRSGTKVSKKPILIPRQPKRKPTARRGATVAQPEPAAETKASDILPAATSPPPSPVDSYTRKCRACGASKRCTESNSEFPTHAELPACQHKSHKTCRPCLTEHIAKVWSHLGLKKLTCPDCPAPIQLRSVENFCGPQIRERYLSLAGADCAEVDPSWRWCLYLAPPGKRTLVPAVPSLRANNVASKLASITVSPGTKSTHVRSSIISRRSTSSGRKGICAAP